MLLKCGQTNSFMCKVYCLHASLLLFLQIDLKYILFKIVFLSEEGIDTGFLVMLTQSPVSLYLRTHLTILVFCSEKNGITWANLVGVN